MGRGFTKKHPLLRNHFLTLTPTHTRARTHTHALLFLPSPALTESSLQARLAAAQPHTTLPPAAPLSFSFVFICSFSLALLTVLEPAWQSKGEKTQMRVWGVQAGGRGGGFEGRAHWDFSMSQRGRKRGGQAR